MSNISASECVWKFLSEVSSALIGPHVNHDATRNSVKPKGKLSSNDIRGSKA